MSEDKKEKPRVQDAVALNYDPDSGDLPRMTAKGRGELAEELVRRAIEHNIPVKYDPDLVQVLSKMDPGEAIPEEVFVVVAELMAFIYWVNQEYQP